VPDLTEQGYAFYDALMHVITTTTGLHLEAAPNECDTCYCDMTGAMALNGKKRGLILLSANKPDLRAICSYMTGTPADNVTDEDIVDTLAELVNMTAGGAKLRLGDTEHAFNLSTPFVVKGDNTELNTKSKGKIVSQILSNGEISLMLTVVY